MRFEGSPRRRAGTAADARDAATEGRRYSRGSTPTPLRATSAEAVDGAGEVADDEAVAVLATLCVGEAQIVHVRAYSPPIEADVEAAAADADGGGDGDAAGEAGEESPGLSRAIRRRAAAGGGSGWRRAR